MPKLVSTDRTQSFCTSQLNRLMGQVIWMQKGLHGLTLKLRVGNTLNLKVRNDPQSMETASYSLGQWLVVDIPQESIYLLSPEVKLLKKRWTRWDGRIVLSARPENESGVSSPTTIKVRGEQVTLHANRILGGKTISTQVGDHVNIMIDPWLVGIRPVEGAVDVARPSHKSLRPDSHSLLQFKRVRLGGTIIRTRQSPAGVFVTLQIGQAVVSAHVTGEGACADFWPAGRRAALIVGQHETWIQLFGIPLPPCLLVYLASDEEVSHKPSVISPASEKLLQI